MVPFAYKTTNLLPPNSDRNRESPLVLTANLLASAGEPNNGSIITGGVGPSEQYSDHFPFPARVPFTGLWRSLLYVSVILLRYLKRQAHPTLTEHERKRLCRVMEYQKLSIDAYMHAAQNEQLPLRVVVQVLFSEQVKISNAIASSSLKDVAAAGVELPHQLFHSLVPSPQKQLLEGTPQSFQEGWAAAKKDINTLKFELESMKAKYLEL
ncbi:hypothetical protein Taro_026612 [Colocasia esculenta]|uniref:NPH3 domain-containing protein n=1 Tax=Colocasia esculenta TaxID=4460 RepID=A0A843VK24_COLES|nr:hypothetical protein [Colocasia esculenta]